MYRFSALPLPKRSREESRMPNVLEWKEQSGALFAAKWMDGSMRTLDKRAEERLDAMRLLIPLAMIVILFVLWYSGMPLLPN